MAKINPFPLNFDIIEDLVMELSPAGIARVFKAYHIEVMEAMIKQEYRNPGRGDKIHSQYLIKKLDKAWNIQNEKKTKS